MGSFGAGSDGDRSDMSYIVYVQVEFIHPSGERFVDHRRSEACVEWSPGVIRVVPIGARWLPPPGINKDWKHGS